MEEIIMKKHFENDTQKLVDNSLLLEARIWKILKSEYPIFVISMMHPRSNKEYTFKLLCDDYPISLQIVDPVDFNPVAYSFCPKGGSFLDKHSETKLPFLCIPGIREYHSHTSHKHETQWVFPNAKFRLPQLMDRVYRKLNEAQG